MTIENLEIKITHDASKATQAIDNLVASLEKLRAITGDSGNFTNFAKGITELGKAMNSVGTKNFRTLFSEAKKASERISSIAQTNKASVEAIYASGMMNPADRSNSLQDAMATNWDDVEAFSHSIETLREKFTNVLAQIGAMREQSGSTVEPMGKVASEVKDTMENVERITGRLSNIDRFKMSNDVRLTNWSSLDYQAKSYANQIDRIGEKLSSVGEFLKGSFMTSLNGVGKTIGTLFSSLSRIAFYRAIRSIIRSVTEAFTTGIQNVAQYSERFNAVMSSISSSSGTFKNALGSATSELITALAPALIKIIDLATSASNALARLFAYLNGSSTYIKAVKYQTDYADALNKTAKSAKALTFGLDELNVISESSGGGGSGADVSDMFEETGIGEVSDFLASIKLTIDDIFVDWSSANPEQKAEQFIAGLGAVLGFVGGLGLTGSLSGGLVGAGIGIALGLVINSLTFDHDGTLSEAEIRQLLVDGLTGISGAFLGFEIGSMFGKPITGAIIGFSIGAVLGCVIQNVAFENGITATGNAIYDSIATALGTIASGVTVKAGAGGLSVGVVGLATFGIVSLTFQGVQGDTEVGGINDTKDVYGLGEAKVTWESFANDISLIWDGIVQATKESTEAIHETMTGGFNDTYDTSFTTWEEIKSSIKRACKGFFDDASTYSGDTKGILNKNFEDTYTTTSTTWEDIKKSIADSFENARLKVFTTGNLIEATIRGWWKSVKEDTSKVWEEIKSAFIGAWEKMKSGIEEPIKKIKEFIQDVIDKVKDAIQYFKEFGDLGVSSTVGTIYSPTLKASGGFVDEGQLFIAREAGAEMVGTIGGKTAVANNDQIVEGIYEGVSSANMSVVSAINVLIRAVENKDMSVSIGDREIGMANDRYTTSRGTRVNTGVFANAY